ncbi:hypothetical protein CDIK_1653 [Cucumispora dikerogammari]|nr:hypothetical protein CDIK_1653 [Cucumispora dikerogammari]
MIEILDFYLKKLHDLLIRSSLKTQLLLLKQYNATVTVVDYSLRTRKFYDLLVLHSIKFKYVFYLKRKMNGIVFVLGSPNKPIKSLGKFIVDYLNRERKESYELEVIIDEDELKAI